MTTFTIIGETKGAPDNSQNELLHIYGQTLATGARAANGTGTGLGLVVWEEAIGVINAGGFVSKFITSATAARTQTIPDATGTIVLGDGVGVTDADAFNTVLGKTSVSLAADFATSLDTAQAVTGFTLPLEVSTTYEIRATLRVKTAASGTAIIPRLTGPAASLDFLTVTARRRSQDFTLTAFDEDAAFTALSGTDAPEIIIIEGIIQTNATSPASDLGLSIASETAATTVTLMEGSAITLNKL